MRVIIGIPKYDGLKVRITHSYSAIYQIRDSRFREDNVMI